eukprot:3187462-Amphidinium_carterae.1
MKPLLYIYLPTTPSARRRMQISRSSLKLPTALESGANFDQFTTSFVDQFAVGGQNCETTKILLAKS